MKILIVSGFLGAGKTTFIKSLAKKLNLEFVVLENEYADLNIDSDILAEEKNLNVYEVSDGCICCSMISDFKTQIKTIKEQIDPDYLIIEPTGVGLLSSIISNLFFLMNNGLDICILNPITIVDVNCFYDYLNEFSDTYKNQIINAGNIILTKINENNFINVEKIKNEISLLNKDANIITEKYESFTEDWFFEKLNTDYKNNIINLDFKFSKHDNLRTFSKKGVSFKDFDSFSLFMDKIINGDFGKVYRGKGFINISGFWGEFELINKLFEMNACTAQLESKIILIGNMLDKEKLEKFLN